MADPCCRLPRVPQRGAAGHFAGSQSPPLRRCGTPQTTPQQQQQRGLWSAGSLRGRPPLATHKLLRSSSCLLPGELRPLSAVSAATQLTNDTCHTALSCTYGTCDAAADPSAVWMLDETSAEMEPLLPLDTQSPAPCRQKVRLFEARRRGVFHSGRLLLEPYAAHPLERCGSDAQLWVVLEGRVDVTSCGASIACGKGASFLVCPRTTFSIIAGESAAELVFVQHQAAGTVGPSNATHHAEQEEAVGRRLSLAAASRQRPGTAPCEQHTALLDAEHRTYVTRLRDRLDRAQAQGLASEAARAEQVALAAAEAQERGAVRVGELDARVAMARRTTAADESAARRGLKHSRLFATILPWCTLGCNYCCTLQHELYKQVTIMAERELGVLERSCEAAQDAILAAESLEWRRLLVASWSISRQREVHELERRLLLREAEVRWLELYVEQLQADLHLRHREHLAEEASRFEMDAWALRQREIELARGTDLLTLREEHFHRLQIDAFDDEVRVRRACLASDEMRERAFAARAESETRARATAEQFERSMQRARDEVRELQEYRTRREAEDAEEEARQREQDQERMHQEIENMKKLKKKKGTLPLPQSVTDKEMCDRCGDKVGKNNYTQHIIGACPERPVACLLCGQAVRAREQQEHLDQCPQRDVACADCGKTYKACHIAVHSTLCVRIRRAREVLPSLPPVLGVETAEAGGKGLRVVAVKPDGPLDAAGLQEDDLIVSVDGVPVLSDADLAAVIRKKRPGDQIPVVFCSGRAAEGQWWESDGNAAEGRGAAEGGCNISPCDVDTSAPQRVLCTLHTTSPIGDVLEMSQLIESDEDMLALRGEFAAPMKVGRRNTVALGKGKGSRTTSPQQSAARK